jgi:long-chain acyl-CoA synthetase
MDAAVRTANATLGPNQRIAGWRLWPEEDFPRTHTLKVKRAPVRAWAAVDAPLPVG